VKNGLVKLEGEPENDMLLEASDKTTRRRPEGGTYGDDAARKPGRVHREQSACTLRIAGMFDVRVVRHTDGHWYVPVNDIADGYGTSRVGAQERGKRQHSGSTRTLRVDTPAGPRESLCLDAEKVPAFVGGIEVAKCRPAIREQATAWLVLELERLKKRPAPTAAATQRELFLVPPVPCG